MKTILHPLAVLVAASVLLGGCGRSPQPQPPSDNQRPPASASGGSEPTQKASEPKQKASAKPPPKSYGWGLPVGDVSPSQDERNVYLLLHKGECTKAKDYLDEPKVWQQFASPRDVLLTWTAVAFCRGDTATATKHYRQAKSLGWKGLRPDDGEAHPACEYYKSAASVIEQHPRSDFSCPTGEPPQWAEFDTDKRQDPR